MKYGVALFSEEGFEDVFLFSDHDFSLGFAAGASLGSSYYGGGVSAYVLPEEQEMMFEEMDPDQAKRALLALESRRG